MAGFQKVLGELNDDVTSLYDVTAVTGTESPEPFKETFLWETKALCAAVIFVVITVCTALPIVMSTWFYKRGHAGYLALQICRCFGGGAFLGATLLHIIPEVDEILKCHLTSGFKDPWDHYPFPMVFVGGGFFAMLIAEKLVHMCIGGHDHKKDEAIEMNDKGHINHAGPENGHTHKGDPEFDPCHNKTSPTTMRERALTNELVRERAMTEGKAYTYESHHAQSHAHGHSHALPGDGSESIAKSVVLLFALSLDCVVEGMALGLDSSKNGAWFLLIAILSHEFIIGFTLGLQLMQNNSKSRTLFLAIFYGLTCPLGIGIGTLISELNSNDQGHTFFIVTGVLTAVTGGVFLYVTFFEILGDIIASEIPGECVLSFIGGFILLGLLMMVPHEHAHAECVGGDEDHGHSHGF